MTEHNQSLNDLTDAAMGILLGVKSFVEQGEYKASASFKGAELSLIENWRIKLLAEALQKIQTTPISIHPADECKQTLNLLPCPFCQQPALYEEPDYPEPRFSLGCSNPACAANCMFVRFGIGNKERCVREWNSRVTPSEISVIDELAIQQMLIKLVEGHQEHNYSTVYFVTELMKIIRPSLRAPMREAVNRTYPELLTEDEKHALLQKSVDLWNALEENKLGGFSSINRPYFIMHEFKEVIEKYGKRDVGLTWSSIDLQKARKNNTDIEVQTPKDK